MPNLLVISDNSLFMEDLCEQIKLYAPEYNINSSAATPDIAILDEKVENLSTIIEQHSHVPVFVFLPKGQEKTSDTALIKYENKPLSLNDILNGLKAAINLAANSDAGRLSFNKYELRPLNKEIINLRNHDAVKLTEKEVAIIQYLYKTKGRIVTKPELLQQVWGYNPEATTHTIETHIYRLRQKVEQDDSSAQLILTEEGGYVLKR